jgi:hypothetical protein
MGTGDLELVVGFDYVHCLTVEFVFVGVEGLGVVVFICIGEWVLFGTLKPTMGFLMVKIPWSHGDIL